MSKEVGPSFSLAAGTSLTLALAFQKPGWQGLIVWVPHPQQVSQLNYANEYVELQRDGTFHFGKTITNTSEADIDVDGEYSAL